MVTFWIWARPWVMPTRFSLRVSAQRAGRPSSRATQQTTPCSGSAPNLAPNAPPTSGVMIRRMASSMPSMPASDERVPCAPWFGIHAVSRPSSPQDAAAARVSIGAGATRWLTIVRETTTSHPSNRSAARAERVAERWRRRWCPPPGTAPARPSAAAVVMSMTGVSMS